jgi:hypothetical protein
MGEFFRKALVHYKRAHRMPETGTVDQWLIDQVPEAYTEYVIPPEAEDFVGPTASKTVRASNPQEAEVRVALGVHRRATIIPRKIF